MLYIILFLISIAGGYVAFRYISLLRALKQIQKELNVIQQDLSKNQMIHLPVPNNRLKELLITINSFLDELHHERARYTKQEKEFQKQIENISHDLRTPLTSLLGYVRLYKKSQSSYISQNAELSDTLDVIERKSESLKNLITQFYDFSRLTAHDYTVNLIKIDTVKLLRESFADKFIYIHEYMHTHHKFSFRQLLEKQKSKMHIVVTFLAVLEMMKLGEIRVEQEETCGEIMIERVEEAYGN